ncbi:MAG: murein biosynthesis integral membrane protein MurJ [Candidatus Andersenbacteria bacterium]
MKVLRQAIPAGSLVLALTTFGSYVVGLFRDRLLAQTFGASRALDAYNAAFLLPDFLFNFLVASGIAAAFVPLFIDLKHQSVPQARRYANTVITTATISMSVAALLLLLFAEPASRLVTPGFTAPDQQLVARLLRIFSLSPILFSASNALGAMLVAERRFFFYGLAPITYNLGIIGGILLFAPTYGIMGVAAGTIAGAVLHLLIRLVDATLTGWRFVPNLAVRTPEFTTTLKLMLPKMFGHPIELATFWAFTAIASTLTPGSIAVLNFARNFQSVPVSLIGIVVATTSFPILAQAATRRSRSGFVAALTRSAILILFASLASAVFIFLVRQPLVAFLLGGRAFTESDVARTAVILGMFCLAIPTEALSHLLARAFYATKNTWVPVLCSVASFALSLLAAWLLLEQLDLLALPLAFFFGSVLKVGLLTVLLPGRVHQWIDGVRPSRQ